MLPEANTATMQEFLDRFAQTLPKDEVAILYLDRVGWHGSRASADLLSVSGAKEPWTDQPTGEECQVLPSVSCGVQRQHLLLRRLCVLSSSLCASP